MEIDTVADINDIWISNKVLEWNKSIIENKVNSQITSLTYNEGENATDIYERVEESLKYRMALLKNIFLIGNNKNKVENNSLVLNTYKIKQLVTMLDNDAQVVDSSDFFECLKIFLRDTDYIMSSLYKYINPNRLSYFFVKIEDNTTSLFFEGNIPVDMISFTSRKSYIKISNMKIISDLSKLRKIKIDNEIEENIELSSLSCVYLQGKVEALELDNFMIEQVVNNLARN